MPVSRASAARNWLRWSGHEPDDIGGIEKCVANFLQASGWRPQLVHHVAGAFRYRACGLLTRYVMKYKAYRGCPHRYPL
jgi:menaquinone-dependent protoporphyrinogen IX oxidase